jgi:hypothetical protein
VKKNWPVLIFAPAVGYLVVVGLSFLPQIIIARLVQEPSVVMGLNIFAVLVNYVLQAYVSVGIMRLNLQAARGESPAFGTVFSGADRTLPLFVLMVIMVLIIGLGLLFLIVPGIILSLGLCMAPYYCADQKLGPIESLKRSWEATTGHKVSLFLFGLAVLVLALVGLLVCVVGVFVTSAIVSVAQAVVYTRLSGTHVMPYNANPWTPGVGSAPGAHGFPGGGGTPPGYGGGAPPGYGGGAPPGYGGGAPPGYGGGAPPGAGGGYPPPGR